MAQADEIQTQRFDESALAHAGHAADTQPEGLPRVRQQRRQQLVSQCAVIGAGRFEQRDGLGHGAALHGASAGQHAGLQLGRNHASAFLICSSTSFALAGIGVPGP
ncbi:hypothetical protein D9M68_893720 [compost metagenome]